MINPATAQPGKKIASHMPQQDLSGQTADAGRLSPCPLYARSQISPIICHQPKNPTKETDDLQI